MKPPVDLRSHRRRAGGQRWKEHNSARQATILEAAIALIEEGAPGAEASIQQIAERAGLARSVVYRQFENREDLDAQAREFIFQRYLAEFEELLVLDPGRSAEEVLLEVMRTVVRWADEHPNLYRFGQTGSLPGPDAGAGAMATFRHRVADMLWQRFSSWTAVLGIDVAPFHPLVFGVVGMVEGVVTQYLSTPKGADRPALETIARLLTSSTWYLFEGHARELGYRFDRSANVAAALSELFADAAKHPMADPTS
ncbi:TetR/AcrR family transcriptional regulator [Nocardia sp. NPDC052566]|uniref:TetR/AcrR family transcriptional regulator n=1 Tax=Nocardia sp. NPDC052566 TaxID=3364330 RepID=UPI0037C6CA75